MNEFFGEETGLPAVARPLPARPAVDLLAAERQNREAWGVSPRTEYGNGSAAAKRRHLAGSQGVAASRLGHGFRIHSRGSRLLAISCRRSAANKSTADKPAGVGCFISLNSYSRQLLIGRSLSASRGRARPSEAIFGEEARNLPGGGTGGARSVG